MACVDASSFLSRHGTRSSDLNENENEKQVLIHSALHRPTFPKRTGNFIMWTSPEGALARYKRPLQRCPAFSMVCSPTRLRVVVSTRILLRSFKPAQKGKGCDLGLKFEIYEVDRNTGIARHNLDVLIESRNHI